MDDDKISQFPEAILCHILSFLPIPDAMTTCILSSRWKYLWTNMSKLTFDDTLPPFNCGTKKQPKHSKTMFAYFVNRALLLHNPHCALDSFSLKCFQISRTYDLSTWISNAIIKRIKSINLVVGGFRLIHLPSNFFNCETLEVLRLQGSESINVPNICCIPKLKTMELYRVRFNDSESYRRLISSSTSLESLVSIGCSYYVGHMFTVSCNTLRDLTFDHFGPNEVNLDIVCPGLRSLCIDNFDSKCLLISSAFLVCKTLEVLELRGSCGSVVIDSARIIDLPSLRILKLIGHMFYDNSETITKVISSCTSLESLSIVEQRSKSPTELNISSSSLKDLNIKSFEDFPNKLVINCPALQRLSLRLYGPGLLDYVMENLSSLEEAEIEIQGRWGNSCDYHSGHFNNLFQSLENVKSLTIKSKILVSEDAFPVFHRLTVLEVNCGWDIVQEAIEKSTRLQDLKLIVDSSNLYSRGIHWRNPTSVPACLLSSLKSMSIHDFEGSEDELAMIEYVLENARIMRTMDIHFRYFIGCKLKARLREKVLKFHRGREKCEVITK